MGTDDLDEILNYSLVSNAILKYIKDAEMESSRSRMSGIKKKEFVIQSIKHNIPNIYDDHSLFISTMIDALILVSNNPSILKI